MATPDFTALRISVRRSGSATEFAHLFSDLDQVYFLLYRFDDRLSRFPWSSRERLILRDLDDPWVFNAVYLQERSGDELSVLPSFRLQVDKIRVESPGFIELIGALRPLETIRNYLNDRHERRKDREYREAADRRKRDLENEDLLNRVLAERIEVYKRLGFTDHAIRQLIWNEYGSAFDRVSSHQDSGLISNAKQLNAGPLSEDE